MEGMKPEERIDNIGFGDLKLIQRPKEFCYGIDAVLLADFAIKTGKAVREKDAIADLGSGSGVIPLILSSKTKSNSIVGFEVQDGAFSLAERNSSLNGLDDRVRFVKANVRDMANEGRNSFLETFGLVTTNPPYTAVKDGITSNYEPKAIARHELLGSLEDFIKCGAMFLKDRGDFAMVNRPSRLIDICCLCRKYKLEPKDICFVSPRMGERPNIMLIHCVKNGGRDLKMLDPIFVYEGREYSHDIMKIYGRMDAK